MALVKSLVQKLIGELVNRPFYKKTATDNALSPQKSTFNVFRWPFVELEYSFPIVQLGLNALLLLNKFSEPNRLLSVPDIRLAGGRLS